MKKICIIFMCVLLTGALNFSKARAEMTDLEKIIYIQVAKNIFKAVGGELFGKFADKYELTTGVSSVEWYNDINFSISPAPGLAIPKQAVLLEFNLAVDKFVDQKFLSFVKGASPPGQLNVASAFLGNQLAMGPGFLIGTASDIAMTVTAYALETMEKNALQELTDSLFNTEPDGSLMLKEGVDTETVFEDWREDLETGGLAAFKDATAIRPERRKDIIKAGENIKNKALAYLQEREKVRQKAEELADKIEVETDRLKTAARTFEEYVLPVLPEFGPVQNKETEKRKFIAWYLADEQAANQYVSSLSDLRMKLDEVMSDKTPPVEVEQLPEGKSIEEAKKELDAYKEGLINNDGRATWLGLNGKIKELACECYKEPNTDKSGEYRAKDVDSSGRCMKVSSSYIKESDRIKEQYVYVTYYKTYENFLNYASGVKAQLLEKRKEIIRDFHTLVNKSKEEMNIAGVDATWGGIWNSLTAEVGQDVSCQICTKRDKGDLISALKDIQGKANGAQKGDIIALVSHLGKYPPLDIPGGSPVTYGPEITRQGFATNWYLSNLKEMESFFKTKAQVMRNAQNKLIAQRDKVKSTTETLKAIYDRMLNECDKFITAHKSLLGNEIDYSQLFYQAVSDNKYTSLLALEEKLEQQVNKFSQAAENAEKELEIFEDLVKFNEEAALFYDEQIDESEKKSKKPLSPQELKKGELPPIFAEHDKIVTPYLSVSTILSQTLDDIRNNKQPRPEAGTILPQAQDYLVQADKFVADFLKKYPQGVYSYNPSEQPGVEQPYDLLNKVAFSYPEILKEAHFFSTIPGREKWGLVTADILRLHRKLLEKKPPTYEGEWVIEITPFKKSIEVIKNNISALKGEIDRRMAEANMRAKVEYSSNLAIVSSAIEKWPMVDMLTAPEDKFQTELSETRAKFAEATTQPKALSDFLKKYWGLCPQDAISADNHAIVDSIRAKIDNFEKEVAKLEEQRGGISNLPAEIEKIELNKTPISSLRKEGKIQITPNEVRDGYLKFSGEASAGMGIERVLVNIGPRSELAQLGTSSRRGDKAIVDWHLNVNFSDNLKKGTFLVIFTPYSIQGIKGESVEYEFSYLDTEVFKNFDQKIRSILDELRQAYQDKQERKVISYLSDDCYNGAEIEDNIERGLDEIKVLENLKVNIGNISQVKDNEASATINWEKVFSDSGGNRLEKKGEGSLYFRLEGNNFKIVKAENIFWEPVGSSAGGGIGGGAGGKGVISGTVTLRSALLHAANPYTECFDFSSNAKVSVPWTAGRTGDLYNHGCYLKSNGGGFVKLSASSLDDVKSVPISGYVDGNEIPGIVGGGDQYEGTILAVKTKDNKYAVIEITDYNENCSEDMFGGSGCNTEYTFNYKYNRYGEPNF